MSSSSLSTPTGSTSLLQLHSVYPSFLPIHGIHSLYTIILETPIVLHAVEEIPIFHEDSILHELIHLFHGITQVQHLLHPSERLLEDSHIPFHMNLAELPAHILTALYLHGFGTFISMLPPETIYLTFWHIFLSFSQEEHNNYLEYLDHVTMSLPCLSPSTHPIPPPLAARLSSPPPSMTPSSPTAINSSTPDNSNTDEEDHAFPIPCDATQHIQLPSGTWVLSSPTQVLPWPDSTHLTLTSPLTKCFHCHLLSHYHEDCPTYTCPHCYLSALGHPSSACLALCLKGLTLCWLSLWL